MNKIIQTCLLWSVLLFVSSATAQERDDGKVQKTIFFTASWEPMNDDLYYLKGGTAENPQFEKISLTEMSRSLPYQVKSEGSLTFYQNVNQGEPVKAVTVKLPPIPSGKRRYLLLFMPKKDGLYRVIAIRDSRKYSPFGAYVFYNLSALPIREDWLTRHSLSKKVNKNSLCSIWNPVHPCHLRPCPWCRAKSSGCSEIPSILIPKNTPNFSFIKSLQPMGNSKSKRKQLSSSSRAHSSAEWPS